MAFNMDPKKCPMPTQDPNVRNKNFKEVALGYTAEMAVNEAKRCLQCKKPACRTGCPVQIDIPAFIAEVAKGDFEAAYQVIAKSSALPAVCGRVCPQENQCEGKCVRGIKGEPVGIGRLERFVADWHREHVEDHPEAPAPNGHKVAIIGAGPSGLTAAGDLAKLGYQVTIYEALHLAGGVLTASSANLSGRPPARTLEELDPELLSALAESGDAGGLLPALSEAEQPAGGEPCGQKRMAELHGGQVGHAAAHQQPAARHKTELCRQRLRSGIDGIRQWRGEFAGGSPVKAAVLAQNLPQQIASVPAALPFRGNFQRFKTILSLIHISEPTRH